MNCHLAQKKLTDALAGENIVPPDVASHQANCAECQVFRERQRRLLASIEAGLQNTVNQPVPPSLLLRLRAQLDRAPAPHSLWVPRWAYAALAATLLLAVSIVVFRNYSRRSDSTPDPDRISARVQGRPDPETPLASREMATLPAASIRANKGVSPAPNSMAQAAPEVIVLAEEQQAYARFVARSLHGPELPFALKAPAPEQADAPIDIALIEIQDVEIAPLDSINGDGQ